MLLLSGTFACSAVVFAYRDYALQKGWLVGRWAFSDTSWIKVLAAVTMIGTPLLGLLAGPWWLVLVVPVSGFFVGLIATNLLRSFVQPIAIVGLAIGWFSSVVLLPSDLPDRWTEEEIANAQHIFASHEANMQASQMRNSGGPGLVAPDEAAKWTELSRTALSHAQQVRDDVLAKAHPEMPSHFRLEYQRSLNLLLDALASRDNAKSLQATMLHDRWVDWWNLNRREIRVPRN
jgi:hypothetical protein